MKELKTYSLIIIFAFSPLVKAEVFSCLDKNGNKIFTDQKEHCVGQRESSELKHYAKAPNNTNFYNEIPDLLQTKDSAGFPGGGKQFCGPVAVSNSLVWLKGETSEELQIELVHKLSSPDYMNTNTSNGTGTSGLIRGVVRYAEEALGGYQKLEYRGWRKAPKKYKSNLTTPTLDFIKSGLHRRGSVWLNIGWYKYNASSQEYHRVGGHWVTLVGYEKDQLVIHDPSPRAGHSFSNEFVNFSLISGGTLTGNKKGLPTKAKGFIKLGSGMHLPSRANAAVIDGAVVLQI